MNKVKPPLFNRHHRLFWRRVKPSLEIFTTSILILIILLMFAINLKPRHEEILQDYLIQVTEGR